MLEVAIVLSLIYTIMFMPLRGKTFETLSASQKATLEKNYVRYMKSRKGRANPTLTPEEYLPILQKQGLVYLIAFCCLLPAYVLFVVFAYPLLLASLAI